MTSTCIIPVPSLTVGTMKSGTNEDIEAVVILHFPEPFFTKVCELATYNTSIVMAGMKMDWNKASLTFAVIINGVREPGFNRYSLIGEIDKPVTDEHFMNFMKCYVQNGQFTVRLGAETDTPLQKLSVWGIHLPNFESDFSERLLTFLE